jgi:dihydroorotase
VSLLIKGGMLVTHMGRGRANLLLSGGRVASVTASEPAADSVMDASGLVVMPGIIDPHVHFRQPGMPAEDWVSGSAAAAAGGVTTVLDMPNTRPPTTTLALLEEKRRLVLESTRGSTLVNFGFHFGATASNLGEMASVGCAYPITPQTRRQAASVKVFMGSSTGDLLITGAEELKAIVQGSRLVTVHAEDEPVIRMHAGENDHASRRPKEAALFAIRKLKAVGSAGRVYVCHLTSWEEAELASPFYKEVTPHHLFLTSKLMEKIGNFAKVNPPLRGEHDRLSLWRALSEGKIHTIGSDHAPHPKEEKEREQAPSGMPGVGTSVPLMLDAASKGLLTLEKLALLMCHGPARIFGLMGKGSLDLGADADVTIINPKVERKVRAEDLRYRCGWTPYEGMALKGWPVATIIGGQVAYRDGQLYPVQGREVTYAL